MRFMLNAIIPHEKFNEAVKDGTAGDKLNQILESIKPEAVYYTEQNGKRSAVLIVDCDDAAKLPSLADPWFLAFNADVKISIVMSPEDLGRSGLAELGKKWA